MTERIPLLKAGEIGSRQVLRIELWWSRDQFTPDFEAWNAGFEEARDLLTQASERHPETVKVYDAVTQDESRALYEQCVKPSAAPSPSSWWNYRISGIFGRDGHRTGWAVPLLLVQFRDVTVPYAAPHEERRGRDGSRTRPRRMILDVLRLLGLAEQQRLFGTQLHPDGGGG